MSLIFEVDLSHVPRDYSVIGVVKMKNKCCKENDVLITQTRGIEVYSCQCSCGGWCTNGFDSISKAISDWERMNNKGDSSQWGKDG